VRPLGYAVLGAQLVVMMVIGHQEVERWNTTTDFGGFAQAWTLIAHAHLDPFVTLFGHPFWKNHFELAMWPLSLLYWVHHSPETLKWVQEIATVGAELVGFRWVLDALERRGARPGLPLAPAALGFLALEVLNPQLYAADWFDFHFEALAAFGVIAAARAFYDRRDRAGVIWCALALLCGDVAGIYVAALGVAVFVCSPRRRLLGAAVAAAGVAWVGIISALGANTGSNLAGYYYLAQGGRSGLTALVIGLVTHPRRPLHVLRLRRAELLDTVHGTGLIGVFAPWIAFLVAAAVVPPALSDQVAYIQTPFQFVLATLAAPIGAVLVLEWLGRRHLSGARTAAVVIGALALAWSLVWSVPRISTARQRWFVVSAQQAAVLHQVDRQIPSQALVVASENVAGHFAQRAHVAAWGWGHIHEVFAITATPVVFLFVDNELGIFGAPAAATVSAYVRDQLHARQISAQSGVYAFIWQPPAGQTTVTVPAP